jgi:hypothetical protein
MYTILWLDDLKGKDHSEELGVNGWTIIRMDLTEIDWEGVDWMHLFEDRDQWRALVNTVTNLRVP